MRIRALFVAILLAVVGRCVLAAGAGPDPDRPSLFSSYDVLQVKITAPLQDLFSTSQQKPDYSVRGLFTHGDASADVEITVRGGTSRRESECPFPKLKLRFDKNAPSVFRDLRTVKIGTHCGDRSDGDLTSRFGRWANEKSPLREAFIYRLLDALDVTSLKARPARITYVDGDRRIVRNAFFLEDDGPAMKRLGGVREIEPAQFHGADRDFSPQDAAKLAFAEAEIGRAHV